MSDSQCTVFVLLKLDKNVQHELENNLQLVAVTCQSLNYLPDEVWTW